MISLIRVGIVRAVDAAAVTARVEFDDLQGMVSAELPILQAAAGDYQTYSLPNIGDQALCVFLDNGEEEGFVLGSIFSDEDRPAASGHGLRYVRFADGGELSYSTESSSLTINASGGVTITGPVTIQGELTVSGPVVTADTITAAGVVTAPAFVQG